MARLLVRTIDGENAQRYMRGDVVAALPDDHIFGRMESLDVWTKEGLDPAKWPGGFAVVDMVGMTVADAQVYTAPAIDKRRAMRIDLDALERRDPAGGRDTLRTQGQITRTASEVMTAFQVKP